MAESENPQIHHKRRSLQLSAYGQHLLGLHRNNTSSPIASYGRRWYNPERRGSISPAPEIVLHWVEADALSGGQHQAERFTVVSYNILGDRNASNQGDLYRNVPQIT
ncbi:hypothetical protein FXO38_06525 [Capsicum annuum]|nr:hypothetical protein FXO38_06525 [Capsicum annuum]KAF3673987.1 hypothetical protein FXO37_06660 [Capsicum annuum]